MVERGNGVLKRKFESIKYTIDHRKAFIKLEKKLLGYNTLRIRVNKSRITDAGFEISTTGIQSWVNSLDSSGKPIILYLPKNSVETIEVSEISDLNIITYKGENTLKIANGNGIIKCKYPTAG